MSAEFKQAIASLHRGAGEPPRGPREPELARLARRLDKLPVGGGGREPADIGQVAAEIRRAMERGITLTSRQLRQGAWCLWNKNTRLAEDDGLRTRLFKLVAMADRAGPFKSLAANFVYAFQADEVGIVEAGELLSSLAPKWEGNWQKLHRDYRIFDVLEGPKALARAAVADDRAPDHILQEHGVDLSGARGGYVKAVIGSLLEQLANGGEPDHQRRIDKVEKYALSANGSPISGDMIRQIAEAILLPFKSVRPAKPLLDRVLNLLAKALGDPRLQPARWRQVPDFLTNMVKGWFSEQSLRQFLDVVGDTTDNPKQWRYRRAFWEGIYNKGLILEAWVAFGSRGAERARSRFGKEVSFGTVWTEGKTVEPGHAVLFLRIGNSLVTDWSHSGRCNIWSDAGAPGVPKLYQLRYGSGMVMIPGNGHTIADNRMAVTHSSPESYSWQRTVADRLYQLTGRRILESDYRIR